MFFNKDEYDSIKDVIGTEVDIEVYTLSIQQFGGSKATFECEQKSDTKTNIYISRL